VTKSSKTDLDATLQWKDEQTSFQRETLAKVVAKVKPESPDNPQRHQKLGRSMKYAYNGCLSKLQNGNATRPSKTDLGATLQ
jgi:hypothetical protein